MVKPRGIKSEKLREDQYREGYDGSLEGKGVEWDGDHNVGAGETGNSRK